MIFEYLFKRPKLLYIKKPREYFYPRGFAL